MSYIITYIINYWWAANYGAVLTAYDIKVSAAKEELINNINK